MMGPSGYLVWVYPIMGQGGSRSANAGAQRKQGGIEKEGEYVKMELQIFYE
tara:strand:- start:30 stop:182 length:153 start_codon:yes stop_codon:yes gene_type:complete